MYVLLALLLLLLFVRNRIMVSLVLLLGFTYVWEFYAKPISGPLYTAAVSEFKAQHYDRSLQLLQSAYRIDPNNTAVLTLYGWDYLKSGKPSVAIPYFNRSLRLNPRLDEPRAGLAYSWLEMGDVSKALKYFHELPESEQRTPDVLVAEARAYRMLGDNQTALRLALEALRLNKDDKLARKELANLAGTEDLEVLAAGPMAHMERPSHLVLPARVQNGFFEIPEGERWKKIYVAGVDLGPALPGHFASEPPLEVSVYRDWLAKISQMGANCVRVYNILPPAFYRALMQHNASPDSTKLYLIQGIWLGGGDDTNVFSDSQKRAAIEEIGYALDVIHGQGNLPLRRGYAGGLYYADVSNYVLGLLLEREMPPSWVLANNQANAQQTSFQGKYITLAKGNATEVWFASLMDSAVSQEVDKYNAQHPVAFANSAALDPLSHPSESSAGEEVAIRRNQGERTAALPPPGILIDDNDVVSLDEMKFGAEGDFQAGIFSAYAVYPFYPDFMYRDPSYLAVRDHQVPDPFLGYLKALKSHYSGMALLIVEYGIPTSIGVSHIQPFGWSDGGLSEPEQGEALARMTRNIADAGCAGGVAFEWQDEWYRADWLAGTLALPADRRALWNNRLDPDQGFGVWTYDPNLTASLFSDTSGWGSAPRLYQKGGGPTLELHDGWDPERTLRSLAVTSDKAFVYVRLEVERVRKGANDQPNLEGAHYFLGISTDPGRFGSRTLPALVPQVRSESGANFLLDLAEDGRARLLIASNYNPRELQPIFGAAGAVQSSYRTPFAPVLADWSGFEEIVVEPNHRRFARDGHVFPAQLNNESLLQYEPPGRTGDSRAEWTCDFAHNAFLFRLPWGLLTVMDPSSHQVFEGTSQGPRFTGGETPGLALFAVSFRTIGPIQFQQTRGGGTPAVDSLPGMDQQGWFRQLPVYNWPSWTAVPAQEGRPKSGYASLQKAFREVRGPS